MVLGEETFKLCVPDANTLEWVESRAMGIYLGRDSSREVGVMKGKHRNNLHLLLDPVGGS